MLCTQSGERLALPAAPATSQTHPVELSHEVEFGGPKVAKLQRIEPDALLGDLNVLMHGYLADRIVVGDVQSHAVRADHRRYRILVSGKPGEVRNERLDHEHAVCCKMLGDVAKAAHLLFLAR